MVRKWQRQRMLRWLPYVLGAGLTVLLLLPLPHAKIDWHSPRRSVLVRLGLIAAGTGLNDSGPRRGEGTSSMNAVSSTTVVVTPVTARPHAKSEGEGAAFTITMSTATVAVTPVSARPHAVSEGTNRQSETSLSSSEAVQQKTVMCSNLELNFSTLDPAPARFVESAAGSSRTEDHGSLRRLNTRNASMAMFRQGHRSNDMFHRAAGNGRVTWINRISMQRTSGATRSVLHGRNYVHLFGLYSSGTNSLQFDLAHGLLSTSVCPDTGVHFKATHERTCSGIHMGKHDAPELVQKFLGPTARQHKLKSVLILRSPFSWLRSILRKWIYLVQCRERGDANWLTQNCSCWALLRSSRGDKLCDLGRGHHGKDTVYTNIVDVWKHYAVGYMQIIKSDQARFPKSRRFAIISYRDLVVEPKCTLSSISQQLDIPRSSKKAVQLQEHSAKLGEQTMHTGRQSAVTDLVTRSYMDYFQPSEVAAVCKQLIPGFPRELMGLLADCHSYM
mmetsp:Transcript_58104/g.135874  ORF Transcript_58104/g.135874 Transcript_58104/m.135874 type:complete len:501 (+) Transcript_58104:49-1551(+)